MRTIRYQIGWQLLNFRNGLMALINCVHKVVYLVVDKRDAGRLIDEHYLNWERKTQGAAK